MQGTRVQSLVQKLRSHMPQNNQAHGTQLQSQHAGAHGPQLLTHVPRLLKLVLHNERSHCSEKPKNCCKEQSQPTTIRGKNMHSSEDSEQPEGKKQRKKELSSAKYQSCWNSQPWFKSQTVSFWLCWCLGRKWALSLNFSNNCVNYSFNVKNQLKYLVSDILTSWIL